MPIRQLQQRLTQVGVIRLGIKAPTNNGGIRPAKLDKLRFTSPSRGLIEAVAAAYGGTCQPWTGSNGPEFEVITQTKEIPVYVPPQTIDPNYEFWGNGYRARLCDGDTEQIRNAPCLCEAAKKRECKPTTRMSLMLADIPSMGTWKLESHGWNAAAELPMLAAAIANATQPIPARLEVQARSKKVYDPSQPQNKQIESRNYMVPVLHFDLFTPAQAFSGELEAVRQAAVTGGPARPALPSAPGVDPELIAGLSREAEAAKTSEQLMVVWESARDKGATQDPGLKALFKELGAKLKLKQSATPAPVAPSAPAPVAAVPGGEAVDAEVEPDRDETWSAIMREAGKRQWNLPAVEEKYRAQMGHDPSDDDLATGFRLAEFLGALKAGEIQ